MDVTMSEVTKDLTEQTVSSQAVRFGSRDYCFLGNSEKKPPTFTNWQNTSSICSSGLFTQL